MKKLLIIFCFLFTLSIFAISCSGDRLSDRDDLDVDFAGLSATIAEALFHNVNGNPDEYMGQTIRAVGTYKPFFYPQNRSLYHYVIVVQGDECCQLFFEFKIPGDNMDLDNFPKEGVRIEVIGVLSRYVDGGASFVYLADSELNILR